MIAFDASPQGSAEWLAARRGLITGSMAATARDKLRDGRPSKSCLDYAMDTARERLGGKAMAVFVNAAMRLGTEQEPIARQRYETETGNLVVEVGFACTDDRKFGCSVDGLIDHDGIWECKTMVSSATLFKAVVDGEISEYRDQCLFEMWLLARQWTDLSLWCPDLSLLHTVRIHRDDDEINRLESDMMDFETRVGTYESRLRAKMQPAPVVAAPASAAPVSFERLFNRMAIVRTWPEASLILDEADSLPIDQMASLLALAAQRFPKG